MIGILNIRNLCLLRLNLRKVNAIVSTKEGKDHNPFTNLSTEKLLQLAKRTDKLNHQSLFFYRYFFESMIQKLEDSESRQISQNTNVEANKVILILTKDMYEVDEMEFLKLINIICQGISKKIFRVNKRILIDLFIKFQDFIKTKIEEDKDGSYYHELKTLLPKLLYMRRGIFALDQILNYLFTFTKTEDQILSIFSLLATFHEKSTNLIAKHISVFLQQKIASQFPNKISDKLIDIKIFEVFIIYDFHRKKPFYAVPLWFQDFLKLFKKKLAIQNNMVHIDEKIRFLGLQIKLCLESHQILWTKLNREKVDGIMDYFQKLLENVQTLSRPENIFSNLSLIFDLIPQIKIFVKKFKYLMNESADIDEVIAGILQNYWQKYILPTPFNSYTDEGKLFLQYFYRLLKKQKIRLEKGIEKKVHNLLQEYVGWLIVERKSFLFVLQMLICLESINGLGLQIIKDILQETNLRVKQLKEFELVRMYHALRILDVKKDVISKGYSDLKGNVHFNTYALSQLNEFLVPLFFSQFPEDKNNGYPELINFMLQSLKNKYNYSEKISEDILEHWIHQKSHIIYKSFNYQQTWDFFYSHLGSPFNQPKIYEVQFVFECIRIALKCEKVEGTRLEVVWKDRKIQNIYLDLSDTIYEIKYFWLSSVLKLSDIKRQVYLNYAYNLLRSGRRENKVRFRVIGKVLEGCMKEKYLQNLKYIEELSTMEKIMNWYDVNGRIDIFFNLYFELLKIEIFIKYLRTFYTPLQILNIVEAFIEYGRAERRVADKIIQQLVGEQREMYNYYQNKGGNIDEQIGRVWVFKNLMRKVGQQRRHELIEKLLEKENRMVYEQFRELISSWMDSLSNKQANMVGEWVKKQFLMYSRDSQCDYFEDYLLIQEWVGSIKEYEYRIREIMVSKIKQGNIYILQFILARNYKMDVFDVVDLIEKLKKRNVWVYMDNELLEEILINLYTLVLVHNNHYLLNQFITQTIPYLPNSHNNNLNMYLSAFGTVSAELIRESNSIVDSDDVVLQEIRKMVLNESSLLGWMQKRQEELMGERKSQDKDGIRLMSKQGVRYWLYDGSVKRNKSIASLMCRYLEIRLKQRVLALDINQ